MEGHQAVTTFRRPKRLMGVAGKRRSKPKTEHTTRRRRRRRRSIRRNAVGSEEESESSSPPQQHRRRRRRRRGLDANTVLIIVEDSLCPSFPFYSFRLFNEGEEVRSKDPILRRNRQRHNSAHRGGSRRMYNKTVEGSRLVYHHPTTLEILKV